MITGTVNAETINGNAGNDEISARDANDTLNGEDGNHTMHGELGDDWLKGGDGPDQLFGEFGHDRLNGGAGNDSLDGGADAPTGPSATDFYLLTANWGQDTITDTGGQDLVWLADDATAAAMPNLTVDLVSSSGPEYCATQITNVTITRSTDRLKATLNPFGTSSTLLAGRTKFKVVVTTGAKDEAGNNLDQEATTSGNQNKVWYFTTGRS